MQYPLLEAFSQSRWPPYTQRDIAEAPFNHLLLGDKTAISTNEQRPGTCLHGHSDHIHLRILRHRFRAIIRFLLRDTELLRRRQRRRLRRGRHGDELVEVG